MKLRTAVPVILLAGSTLLPSCVATIVSGSRQGVKINANPSGATVYLNDKRIGETPAKANIKRSTGGEIRIEKEGYKTHTEILYPAKFNAAAIPSMFFFFYPYYVDVATGAAMRLNKKHVTPKLIKLPNKTENTMPVASKTVTVKFKAGEKLGNLFIKENPKEILYFDKTLDVEDSELKDNVNVVLRDLGFNVPKDDKDGMFTAEDEASFLMNAEVKELKYDIHASHAYESQAKFETRCKMTVNWKLVNRNDEVKFEATTIGESTKYEKGGTAAFYDAFENSLYEFLYNQQVYDVVKLAPGATLNKEMTAIMMKRPAKLPQDKVINSASKCVVTIQTGKGHGSGSIISTDGYIVTNYHVVSGVDKVKVNFSNGMSLDGEVVRTNKDFDLALVKVSGSGFSPLVMSEDKEIDLGADVYAIGTPADKDLSQTVTKGIISGERSIKEKRYIQTDVSINPGSSGGALVNKQGVLVGVVNAKVVGKGVEGIGFAIPTTHVFDKLGIKYQ